MKNIRFAVFGSKVLSLVFLSLASCATRPQVFFLPDAADWQEPSEAFAIGEIVATKSGGAGKESLPGWLYKIIYGGVSEAEMLDEFYGNYIFIGRNRGGNFTALSRWADKFTVFHDFPRLAAARIEERLIYEAVFFPDDEYGDFFVNLIRMAWNREYPEAHMEEVYWIRTLVFVPQGYEEPDLPTEVYEFFVLMSIEKQAMQNHVRQMMAASLAASTANRNQRAAINRAMHVFFEGF